MKKVNVPINLFEKNDYVRTPEGVGIIIDNEIEFIDGGFMQQYVYVQHKFDTSSNTSNDIIYIEARGASLINKEEYDKEKE
jgi:hypothetical protein